MTGGRGAPLARSQMPPLFWGPPARRRRTRAPCTLRDASRRFKRAHGRELWSASQPARPLPPGMSMFSTKGGLYERARKKFKISDGIKLFSYPFYKQRRLDVQVCSACGLCGTMRHRSRPPCKLTSHMQCMKQTVGRQLTPPHTHTPQAFFAQIYSEAQSSRAAQGHHALANLWRTGLLRRHYTMNIDGLAEVVGMDTWHHENNPSGVTVEMHGNIRCVVGQCVIGSSSLQQLAPFEKAACRGMKRCCCMQPPPLLTKHLRLTHANTGTWCAPAATQSSRCRGPSSAPCGSTSRCLAASAARARCASRCGGALACLLSACIVPEPSRKSSSSSLGQLSIRGTTPASRYRCTHI